MSMDEKENSRSARILIVDDEASITELLNEMLLMLGHTAQCCTHPAEALALMEKENFDLVLSDYRMPGMNGQQFYAAVLDRCPHLAKRIVFLTGDVANENTWAFLKKLGNPTLSKPFQFGEVMEMIPALLQKTPALAA
jgi:CheY-like chemotaxis protein